MSQVDDFIDYMRHNFVEGVNSVIPPATNPNGVREKTVQEWFHKAFQDEGIQSVADVLETICRQPGASDVFGLDVNEKELKISKMHNLLAFRRPDFATADVMDDQELLDQCIDEAVKTGDTAWLEDLNVLDEGGYAAEHMSTDGKEHGLHDVVGGRKLCLVELKVGYQNANGNLFHTYQTGGRPVPVVRMDALLATLIDIGGRQMKSLAEECALNDFFDEVTLIVLAAVYSKGSNSIVSFDVKIVD
jgi:DNA-binding phage protein